MRAGGIGLAAVPKAATNLLIKVRVVNLAALLAAIVLTVASETAITVSTVAVRAAAAIACGPNALIKAI
jgi:hypothetical protein